MNHERCFNPSDNNKSSDAGQERANSNLSFRAAMAGANFDFSPGNGSSSADQYLPSLNLADTPAANASTGANWSEGEQGGRHNSNLEGGNSQQSNEIGRAIHAIQSAEHHLDREIHRLDRMLKGMGGTDGSGTTTPTTGDGSGTTPPTTGDGSGTMPPTTGDGSGTMPPTTGDGSGTTPPTTGDGSGTTPPTTGDGSGTTPPTTGDGSGTTPPTTGDGSGTTPPTTGDGSGTTPPTNSTGEGFSQSNGKLLINGKPLNGIAITGEYAASQDPTQLATQIKSQFPGINVVRLATSPDGGAFTNGSPNLGGLTGQTVDNINADIKAFNAQGIAVIVDDHAYDANTPNNAATGAALTNEENWYQQIAQANAGNNMVMYQTPNEPMGSAQDIVNEQVGVYNAVRAVDNNAFVSFDLEGGGGTNPMTSNPSAYATMHNVAFDAHFYASNSSDPAASLQQEIAPLQAMTDQNGHIPVYVGETGNSIDGSNPDPLWQQALNNVWSDGTGGIAWLYDGLVTGAWSNGSNVDTLTNGNQTLNSYGQYIAQLIQNGAS